MNNITADESPFVFAGVRRNEFQGTHGVVFFNKFSVMMKIYLPLAQRIIHWFGGVENVLQHSFEFKNGSIQYLCVCEKDEDIRSYAMNRLDDIFLIGAFSEFQKAHFNVMLRPKEGIRPVLIELGNLNG